MPKLDLDAIPQTNRTGYPAPFDTAVAGRWYRRLGPASGLTHMGVSHVVLKPGAWSSQRHWHDDEDEFVVILSGEAELVDDTGVQILRAGDCASFPAGEANGHHLRNVSGADCVFIAVGAGNRDGGGSYSDIDMTFSGDAYSRKDGTPYAAGRIP
jgi:uncharacterized cupin superfamily protein